MSPPEFLYKYIYFNKDIEKKDPDYYENIFAKNEIYFPTLNELNDPYDANALIKIDHCSEDVLCRLFLKHNRNKLSREKFRELERWVSNNKHKVREVLANNIQTLMGDGSRNRVLSLSANPKSAVMWAHYSNNYKGFCLKFKPESFDQKFIDIFGEVKYKDLRPVITPEDLEDMNNDLKESVFTKSKEWWYEKEWRIFTTVKLHPKSKLKFRKEFLQGVIFGLRMEPSDKDKISQWIKLYRNDIEIKNIALCNDSFELSIV